MKTFPRLLNKNSNFNTPLLRIFNRTITSKDIKINNTSTSYHIAHDTLFNPKEQENFANEYQPTHPSDKKLNSIKKWGKAPYDLGIFDETRDTELKRFAWNVNGYFNSLSSILFRSKYFQNEKVLRFLIKNFNHRSSMEINKAEEPPKLTTNSIFLYKDSTNTTLNRRGIERLFIFMLLTQALNVPSAIMYLFVAWYFNLLQKNIFLSRSMVKRMDLIPENEQIHLMKIGLFGFPRSELMNISDLIKVDKEEDLSCKLILIFFYFY